MIHALSRSFLGALRQLCSAQLWEATSAGNWAGCQVTFKTVWSKSACSARRTEAALWILTSEGNTQPGKKGWPLSASATQLRGDSKHYGWVSPFLNVPQIVPVIELLVFLLFLEGLLYCIQIHIWKRLPPAKSNSILASWLLGLTEESLQTQASQWPHMHSQDGKPDLRSWHARVVTTDLVSSKYTAKMVNKACQVSLWYSIGWPHDKKQTNHPPQKERVNDNTRFYGASSVSSKMNPIHRSQCD